VVTLVAAVLVISVAFFGVRSLLSSYAATTSTTDCAHAIAAGGPDEICGFFVVHCQLDHEAHDDPIVFPGMPAATHLHEFFGAKGINYNSTPDTMRTSATTCDDTKDTGGYWTPPALISGRLLNPTVQNEYWFDGGFQKTELIPFGMEIVAGNAHATAPLPTNEVYYFCGIGSPHRDTPYACTGADKGSGQIIMVVVFPQCWNGYMNAHNNAPNMAYPTGFGQCPPGFPHVLPRLEEHVHIGITTPFDAQGNMALTLSSGPFYTLHGDFVNSWHLAELNAFVSSCINAHKTCGNAPIGPGTLPTPSPLPSPTPAPTPAPVPGDINGDGKVNTLDLSSMLSMWGTTMAMADLNHDGAVNTLDLSILLAHWTG
jgi:hypothetical protein